MWKDPIVKETRKLREQYAASCGNEPDAVYKNILERQTSSQRVLVTRPARQPKAIQKTA